MNCDETGIMSYMMKKTITKALKQPNVFVYDNYKKIQLSVLFSEAELSMTWKNIETQKELTKFEVNDYIQKMLPRT